MHMLSFRGSAFASARRSCHCRTTRPSVHLTVSTSCTQSLLALKQLEANMRREELLFSQLGVDFFLNVRSAVQCRCIVVPSDPSVAA